MYPLSDWFICTTEKFWNVYAMSFTLHKYYTITYSLVSYCPRNCWTINWELLWAINYVISNFCANLIPTINASYSATLLVLGKTNHREYSNISPSGGTSTIPAPLPYELDAPSTNSSHSVCLSSLVLLECVHSTIKSAKAYPFMACRVWNYISYLHSSMDHLVRRPEHSGFYKILLDMKSYSIH